MVLRSVGKCSRVKGLSRLTNPKTRAVSERKQARKESKEKFDDFMALLDPEPDEEEMAQIEEEHGREAVIDFLCEGGEKMQKLALDMIKLDSKRASVANRIATINLKEKKQAIKNRRLSY